MSGLCLRPCRGVFLLPGERQRVTEILLKPGRIRGKRRISSGFSGDFPVFGGRRPARIGPEGHGFSIDLSPVWAYNVSRVRKPGEERLEDASPII